MKIALAAALLAAAMPAYAMAPAASSGVTVEVATGDWSNVPWMKSSPFNIITPQIVGLIHESFERDKCRLEGQSKKRLNLDLPFLVEFGESGEVKGLVLRKIGCPAVESLLASVLLKQVQAGDYRAPPGQAVGWYRSQVQLRSS